MHMITRDFMLTFFLGFSSHGINQATSFTPPQLNFTVISLQQTDGIKSQQISKKFINIADSRNKFTS